MMIEIGHIKNSELISGFERQEEMILNIVREMEKGIALLEEKGMIMEKRKAFFVK